MLITQIIYDKLVFKLIYNKQYFECELDSSCSEEGPLLVSCAQ
jgi:hypothetical protein